MDLGVKKFLPELLHFLYIVLQGFIGVRETGEYFCDMGSFCFLPHRAHRWFHIGHIAFFTTCLTFGNRKRSFYLF